MAAEKNRLCNLSLNNYDEKDINSFGSRLNMTYTQYVVGSVKVPNDTEDPVLVGISDQLLVLCRFLLIPFRFYGIVHDNVPTQLEPAKKIYETCKEKFNEYWKGALERQELDKLVLCEDVTSLYTVEMREDTIYIIKMMLGVMNPTQSRLEGVVDSISSMQTELSITVLKKINKDTKKWFENWCAIFGHVFPGTTVFHSALQTYNRIDELLKEDNHNEDKKVELLIPLCIRLENGDLDDNGIAVLGKLLQETYNRLDGKEPARMLNRNKDTQIGRINMLVIFHLYLIRKLGILHGLNRFFSNSDLYDISKRYDIVKKPMEAIYKKIPTPDELSFTFALERENDNSVGFVMSSKNFIDGIKGIILDLPDRPNGPDGQCSKFTRKVKNTVTTKGKERMATQWFAVFNLIHKEEPHKCQSMKNIKFEGGRRTRRLYRRANCRRSRRTKTHRIPSSR